MNKFTSKIAKELNLSTKVVENTLELLNNGATIPFISRYRKEQTGGLDEVNIGLIKDLYDKEVELSKRKETVIKTITEAGKMTKELLQQIEECPNAAQLEDLYLPFKPKRRTKAQIAKEKGLEPLAQFIMIQRENNIEQKARAFLSPDIKDVNEAIKGAQDIIAELFSEDQRARQMLRKNMQHEAIVVAKQKKGLRNPKLAVEKMSKMFGSRAGKVMAERFLRMNPLSVNNIVRDCSNVRLPKMDMEMQKSCVLSYGEKDSDLRLARRKIPKMYPEARLVVDEGYGHCERMVKDAEGYARRVIGVD